MACTDQHTSNGTDSKCALVTGGCGYIGSHTVLELLQEKHISTVIVLDNLVNSCRESLNRVVELSGKDVVFFKVDIRDPVSLRNVFSQFHNQNPKEPKYHVDYVLHFAGYKCVGESVQKPLMYYQNNVQGTLTLLQVMQEYSVSKLVFSSSCTVYGDPQYLPVDENHPTGNCTNPYGRSKYMVEQILQDLATGDKTWSIVSLRYFNPVGAHPSGCIGEDPEGIPNNLMPYIAQVAVGKKEKLAVFGDDYSTPDGTGIRDYIHVVELAKGHVQALDKLNNNTGFQVYNLGTGQGYSVLEMIDTFSKSCGHAIPYCITERRAGDVATTYADPTKASKELNWTAKMGIQEMCADTWNWQVNNPNGYTKK